KAVLTGVLQEGEQLPPVRQLALELLINPNTVVRAYQELEREGIITTRRGSGTFIAPAAAKLNKVQKEEELKRKIRELLAEARFLGIEKDVLKEIFLHELEEKKK
ncbi:MAG: GntR family transcriptional regulator, partial [Bacillota bacterium]